MRKHIHSCVVGLLAAVFVLSTAGVSRAESGTAAGVVNINTASANQLQMLPGIGPSKARAIIEWRSAHPFGSPQELVKVKGIGRKLFSRISGMVVVRGETTLKAPAKKKKGSKRRKK